MSGFAFDDLDDAIEALADRLGVVPASDDPIADSGGERSVGPNFGRSDHGGSR